MKWLTIFKHYIVRYINYKYDKVDKTLKEVTFKTTEVNTLLGMNLNDEDIETELKRLDF